MRFLDRRFGQGLPQEVGITAGRNIVGEHYCQDALAYSAGPKCEDATAYLSPSNCAARARQPS